MMSRSYTNLMDLASGNFPVMGLERRRLPRVMTVAGVISELDDDQSNSVSSDAALSVPADRIIIVANQLPIKAKRRPDNKAWSLSWDEDSLLSHIKDGLPDDMEVLYVGSLKVEVELSEQDEVAQLLLDRFNCVAPFFLWRFCPSIIMDFVSSICGPNSITCFHMLQVMEVDLIAHGGKHMLLLTRFSHRR